MIKRRSPKEYLAAILACYLAAAAFGSLLFCFRDRAQPWFIEHENPHWIEFTNDYAIIGFCAGFFKFLVCGTGLIFPCLEAIEASKNKLR